MLGLIDTFQRATGPGSLIYDASGDINDVTIYPPCVREILINPGCDPCFIRARYCMSMGLDSPMSGLVHAISLCASKISLRDPYLRQGPFTRGSTLQITYPYPYLVSAANSLAMLACAPLHSPHTSASVVFLHNVAQLQYATSLSDPCLSTDDQETCPLTPCCQDAKTLLDPIVSRRPELEGA